MKKIKCVFCSFLIICIMFCLLPMNNVALAARVTVDKAENRLLMLGIVSEKKDYSDNVTLAEYVTMILRSMGFNNEDSLAKKENSPWYEASINLGENLGLMGFANVDGPESAIDVRTALVITTVALGYSSLVENTEEAVFSEGTRIGILKNISFSGNTDALTREVAYLMIYNALEIDMCLSSVHQINNSKHEIIPGDTWLANLYKMQERQYFEGILYGDSITSVNQSTSELSDLVNISGRLFEIGNVSIDGLMGKGVCFYADFEDLDDDSLGKIVWIEEKSTNKQISISGEDVENLSFDKMEYYDGSKHKTVTLDSPGFIYNNRYISSPNELSLSGEERLSVIDNDEDNKYEVVIAEDIKSFVIGSVLVNEELITFDFGETFMGKNAIDLSEIDGGACVRKIINDKGEDISIEQLKKGDGISVMASKDLKYICITKCGISISGKITAIDSDEKNLVINGEKYKFVGELNPKIGQYTVFFDIWNRVYYLKNVYSDYVYVMKAFPAGDDRDMPSVKVFTPEGGFTILNLTTKTKIDGISGKSANEAFNLIVEKGVARVDVNDMGELKKIDFAKNYATSAKRLYCENDKGFCDYSEKIAEPFKFDESSKIFFVPKSGDEHDFFNAFPLSDDTEYVTEAFDYDEQTKCAGAVVIEMDYDLPLSGGFNTGSKYIAVNSVDCVYDGEDTTYTVSGISEGVEVTLSAAQRQSVFNVMSELNCGDVLEYIQNWDNEICLGKIAMQQSTLTGDFYNNSDYKNVSMYLQPTKVNKNVMTNLYKYAVNEIYCTNGSNEIKTVVPYSTVKVSGTDNKGFSNYFLYDRKEKRFKKSEIDGIVTKEYQSEAAPYIFSKSINGAVQFIVEFTEG